MYYIYMYSKKGTLFDIHVKTDVIALILPPNPVSGCGFKTALAPGGLTWVESTLNNSRVPAKRQVGIYPTYNHVLFFGT
jgi:hypothetical protein